MFIRSTAKPLLLSISMVLLAALAAGVILLIPHQPADDTSTPELLDSPSVDIPALQITTILSELDHPWGMAMLEDGSLVFTQRNNKISYWSEEQLYELNTPTDTYVRGEGGMLGLALDPDFSSNHFLYTCFNSTADQTPDVRVVRWFFDIQQKKLSDRQDIITGMPSNTSGRHSGCQLGFGPDGYLWVGTGDTADATASQNPASLGGKVLRVDKNGDPAPGNLDRPFDPRIYNYGHRNVQGLGFFDPDERADLIGISIEHGPDRDDEVNLLTKGNFGWDPLPNYGEGVPMTDLDKFPDAVAAIWSSGNPTIATSGGTVIHGDQWLAWDQAVAVAGLKSNKIVILELGPDLTITRETSLFQAEYGRIRTVHQGTDGYLYILTDNGSNKDKIMQIKPVSKSETE